jgi:hypothetical protein
MLSNAEKDAIATAAQRMVEHFVIPKGVERWRACLWYSFGAIPFLKKVLKTRVIAQAGTASWPRIRMEDDDGEVMTHFSYVFDAHHEMTAMSLALRQLPEMHCWLALPETGEVIDLSAGFQAEACEKHSGHLWEAPPPPSYYWFPVTGGPEHVHYDPDPVATRIAIIASNSCVRFRYPRTTWPPRSTTSGSSTPEASPSARKPRSTNRANSSKKSSK